MFAINDNIALDLLETLPTLKKSIPSDIKVIGFDDSSIARHCYPKLSSVRQDTQKIADLAVASLINRIDQVHKNIEPVKLIVRASTS
ncbi:substrate-binding domain-containing protein [Lactobacillus sp. DCY120]|uniref:Substrate-binding domain-containing protein n=1 Tax=Bombilactobacillus apium TaxID=2675299 RepID=A0A850R8E5_9LACO|nr:substrate-binding domain-containing protein [Bombilactobacillus apium]